MTCGIYQLTFTSGKRYIGKSVNIEDRWNQHRDAMTKGTAAKQVLMEYRMHGFPQGKILTICHKDHLDILEALYISRNSPELNTTRPPDPFPDLPTNEDLSDIFSYFSLSTRELIDQINDLSTKYLFTEKLADTRLKQIESLKVERTQKMLAADINREIEKANSKYTALKELYDKLEREVLYHRQPWWKKWF